MRLTITIDMNNAAFEGNNGDEVARILRDLADRKQFCTLSIGDRENVWDINGNTVGKMEVTR